LPKTKPSRLIKKRSKQIYQNSPSSLVPIFEPIYFWCRSDEGCLSQTMKTKLQGATLLLILVSLVGCATQPHLQQAAQPDAQKTPEQEPAKAPMPTFTYRPGG
jgi:hypothetical protein